MKTLFLTFFFLTLSQIINAQHSIIPEPVSFEGKNASFVLRDVLNFNIETQDPQTNQYINQFKTLLEKSGITAVASNKIVENSITFTLNKKKDNELGVEGYLLDVTNSGITLTANGSSGIFNGLQSLRQLLPPHFETITNYDSKSIQIPGCKIKDYPRFGWRGLMLDVSRHFFTVEEVKSFIDQMSQYKFNVFHWHLTDDQGWRIEIKSYPKLTEVGAWRVERHGYFGTDRTAPKEGEKATYGGYYTQEDIKEVVQYALDRNITIVPEIDFPGHSMAALAAYPELASNNDPKYVEPGGKFVQWNPDFTFEMFIENMLNPADEGVYDFVDKIFTEIAALFPGKYIHMGGDEAYHGYWEENPEVQKFMKANKIANGNELQSYFVKRIEKIISSKNKKMIGWGEILIGGLADGATVMSWHDMQAGLEAAKLGHDVIMTPRAYTYLDLAQGDHSVETQNRYVNLEKVYSFDPIPESIDPKFVLGGQGCLWTERIPNLPFAFYMTYPRAFALSEALWTPKENKDWEYFIQKTEIHFKRFDLKSLNISKAVYDPIVRVYKDNGKLMCELTNSIPGTEIFYTINNTYPVRFGKKYTDPFEIPMGDLSLRTQTYRNDKPMGRMLLIHRTDLEKRANK
ncbi:beta-N-acetylhexosaminidase [Aestuariivivens insulae]|uniref:beta-N-acetylhexosaminidase n=1 Tax=Aestuariivivens insulae TaxID=1621988 RepID=UPI001F57F991|nr:family 20 glycosylhydrolase [Aestuariivivens insulae]